MKAVGLSWTSSLRFVCRYDGTGPMTRLLCPKVVQNLCETLSVAKSAISFRSPAHKSDPVEVSILQGQAGCRLHHNHRGIRRGGTRWIRAAVLHLVDTTLTTDASPVAPTIFG